MKIYIFFLTFIFASFFGNIVSAKTTNLYFFYGDGCPHCAKEEKFLDQLGGSVNVKRFEVWHDQKNAELLKKVSEALGNSVSGVPVTIVNGSLIVGYNDDKTTGKKINEAILNSENIADNDVVWLIIEGKTVSGGIKNKQSGSDNIISGVFGEINLKSFSLPALTVVVGLLDSLNPCAMWVLLFLIGLLLGMDNRPKMWLLGWTFIGSSALAYFVFLAAWLNIYQFISYISWINLAIASVAIVVGLFNIWDFWVNRNGGCDISGSPTKRKMIMDKIKNFALNKSFFVAMIGLAIIGAAVNMVELLCSAGLPAVYIPILTSTAKSQFVYYGYLIAYVFFYILIQIIVFLFAMLGMKQVAIGSKITRWFGLISGLLMIIVGLFLVFKPSLLSLF